MLRRPKRSGGSTAPKHRRYGGRSLSLELVIFWGELIPTSKDTTRQHPGPAVNPARQPYQQELQAAHILTPFSYLGVISSKIDGSRQNRCLNNDLALDQVAAGEAHRSASVTLSRKTVELNTRRYQ
ncbi:hypothetical protein CIHG_02032 [Coccidioides immitis H538.4]|uniref:Uncharacterized protein n=1 Tax=Coccidioides immitis H538.4 TaxID=396776 RepID=A0A0J8RI11_COCIT|nr:hypothetical protein CIHG_02032 [Coccidioides immitis H538.4]